MTEYRYSNNITDTCRLTEEEPGDNDREQLGAGLAGALVAVREGRRVAVGRGPLGHPYYQAAIVWDDDRYGIHRSHVAGDNGRYRAVLHPNRHPKYALMAGDHLTGDGNCMDKILDAINCHCQVGRLRQPRPGHPGLGPPVPRQPPGDHPGPGRVGNLLLRAPPGPVGRLPTGARRHGG